MKRWLSWDNKARKRGEGGNEYDEKCTMRLHRSVKMSLMKKVLEERLRIAERKSELFFLSLFKCQLSG